MQTGSDEGSAAAASTAESVVRRLADDMVAAWRAGRRPVAEEYLNRHASLWDRQELALELIAEEMALRDEYREPLPASEFAARFPRWAASVRALEDCQRAIGGYPSAPRFPAAGEWLDEFRLVRELGRGATGRVFLATQASLADRRVVLKLSARGGGEHLSLARLQHPNIVPLYSAHEFPDRGLRGLCLPDCGGQSLEAILTELGGRPARTRTGADILTSACGRDPEAPARPPRVRYAAATYPEAICHIGIRLAEALQFAHDCGLLHLDLKPSNVLVAADGTPMLLDFHLARPPLSAGDPPPAWLGGTSGYMAPELEAAIAAVRAGGTIPAAVGGRADVYSLGVLLAGALGHEPNARGSTLSPGLAGILARCTALAPGERYASAGEVAEDLRRHTADLPLRGVPNRSLVERWKKWRRRRPFALSLCSGMAAMLLGAVGGAGYAHQHVETATAALHRGEEHVQAERFSEAVEAFRGGAAVLTGVPFCEELAARLRGALARAERRRCAAELHHLAEHVRTIYEADDVPLPVLRDAEVRCQSLWGERESVVRRLADLGPEDLKVNWRTDLLDLAIVFARLHVRTSDPNEILMSRKRALDTLVEAESFLGPSAGLYHERAVQARPLGLAQLAVESRRAAESYPVKSAWELRMLSRAPNRP